MKLLIIASDDFFSSYGGGQIYVKNLVDEFIRQGIYPSIATPNKQKKVKSEYKGCQLYFFNTDALQSELKKLLWEINPAIVHAHGYKASFTNTCSTIGVPCIVTAHHGGILCPAGTLLNYHNQICHKPASNRDCLPCVLKNIRGGIVSLPILQMVPLSLRWWFGRLLKRLPFIPYLTPVGQTSFSIKNKKKEWETIYKKATQLIAPSHAIAQSMILNGAAKKKITVIPHGIPLQKSNRFNIPIISKPAKPIRFFFVGRICHVKGVHILLKAFHLIHNNAELHIIGGTGNKTEGRYRNSLKKKYKFNSHIVWHGKIDHNKVEKLMAQFDIMVHPTISMEVFGLNISEALAMGKFVIATRCGGAEMQIKNGVNGWLVAPNDINALSSAMKKIFNGLHLLNRRGGQESTVFSVESHCNELQNLYRKNITKRLLWE
jgi:glycosyltransferase involved in cell wall biosynthesis